MAEHELAVAIRAGQRAGVAIDAQDRRRHFGARLPHDQLPRRLALRALRPGMFHSPAIDGILLVAGRRRREALRLERIRCAARAARVLALEPAVLQRRLELRAVFVEAERRAIRSRIGRVVDVTFSSPLKNEPLTRRPDPENSIRNGTSDCRSTTTVGVPEAGERLRAGAATGARRCRGARRRAAPITSFSFKDSLTTQKGPGSGEPPGPACGWTWFVRSAVSSYPGTNSVNAAPRRPERAPAGQHEQRRPRITFMPAHLSPRSARELSNSGCSRR